MLLENGYGIENWAPICGQILAWQMPIHLTEQDLMAQGFSGEELHSKMQELKEDKADLKQVLLKTSLRTTGVDDLGLIEKLMEIPLQVVRNEAPFGYSGTATREGDKILTDDDWMTDTHRHYLEKHRVTLEN